MGPFAMMAIALEIVFWLVLLAVATVFVTALIRGTIEDIRDHKRIAAARKAISALPPPSEWEDTYWSGLTRTLRRNLHF